MEGIPVSSDDSEHSEGWREGRIRVNFGFVDKVTQWTVE